MKRIMDDHLTYLNQYNMNAFKLTLALFIARAYLSDGRITVLNKFDRFFTDRERSSLYGVRHNGYMIKLFSHKFFHIIEEGMGSSGLLHRISFGQKGNYSRYKTTGWKVKNISSSYNTETVASISMKLKKKKEPLQFNMLLIPQLNYKKKIYHRIFSVRINGRVVATICTDRKAWHSINIPKNLAGTENLKIELLAGNEVQFDGGKGSLLIIKANLVEKPAGSILRNRLINNSILFGLPAGEVEYINKSGNTTVLPYYKAAGIASEYFKNYTNWRSNTLLISTSDGKLKKEIKNAQKKEINCLTYTNGCFTLVKYKASEVTGNAGKFFFSK